MTVTGFEEFEANLKKLKLNNQKQARSAVKEAAEKYAEILEQVTPIGDGIPAGHERDKHAPLASSVVNTGIKKDRDASFMTDVGFNKSQGWRAHFPDSGTVDQRAQKFVDRSREQSKEAILSVYKKHMREAMML